MFYSKKLSTEKTLAFRDHVYKLRAETQQAFDEAKALEVKAKQLERKQQELHQVCTFTISFGHFRDLVLPS